MRRNGDRGKPGGDREILDRSYGFHRTGDRWLPDRWLGMPPFSGVVPPPVDQPVKIDSWPVSNLTSWDNYFGGGIKKIGQAFPCPASGTLYSVKFQLKRIGSPPAGTITAKLYAASGVMGSSAIYSGSPLAASSPISSTAITSTTGVWVEFLFIGTYPLMAGTNYAVMMEESGLSASTYTNCIACGIDDDGSTPNHPGNTVFDLGSPYPDANSDTIFELYTGTPAPVAPPVPVLVNSWPLSNQNDIHSYTLDADVTASGQCFTGNGNKITSVKFGLLKIGSPTGNIVARIYAATGAFPVAKPTGTPLASSDPIDATTVSTSAPAEVGAAREFLFTGANQFTTVVGTKYWIGAERISGAPWDFNNKVGVGCDFDFSGPANPGHPGNYANNYRGSWGADDLCDLCFELWGLEGGAGSLRVVDKWDVDKQTHVGTYYGLGVVSATMPTPQVKVGQAITSDGYNLKGCRFFLKRIGPAATTNLVVRLYACAGIPGTNGEPTGSPLAVSEPVPAASVTDVDGDMYDFVFSGDNQVDIPAGGRYVFSLEEEVELSLGPDSIQPGFDMLAAGATHPGNMFFQNVGAAPYALGTYEMTFYLVGTEILPEPPPELMDSWPVENENTNTTFKLGTNYTGDYQAFTSNYGTIHSAKFSLAKQGVPTGPMVAKLYLSDYIPGTSAKPTGEALAVSDPLDASILTDTPALYEFFFTGANQYVMALGFHYCIGLEFTSLIPEDVILVGLDAGVGGHYGNIAVKSSNGFGPNALNDLIFYLYKVGGETPPPPEFEDANIVQNMNDGGSYGFFTATIWGVAESFTAHKGEILSKIKVWAKRNAGNVDNQPLVAHIYESTTTVDQAIPEGIPIASSDPFDSALFTTASAPEPVEFLFTGANQIQFVKDKVYCFSIERPNTQSMDVMRFGFWNHGLQPGHPGVYSQNKTFWDKDYAPGFDMIFYVINP